MSFANDEKVIQWLDQIEAKESTRKTYVVFIDKFCECIKKSPTELIEEATKEIKQGLLASEKKSSTYISQFKRCLDKEGYAPKSFRLGVATITSFYGAYDIILPKNKKSSRALPLRENQYFLTREDIKKLIANAKNLREKSIILMMSTSGMARNEIINLKIQDITFDSSGIGIVSVRRLKAQVDYTTFISPEAVIALKNYYEERNRTPVTSIKGQNDYVFVTYHTNRHGEKCTNLDKGTFVNLFRILGEQLGFENESGFVKSRSHALRKYFASTLENAGLPKHKIDFMLGHTQSGNDYAYFKTDINALKELYLRYLPYLMFEKTIEVRSLDTKDANRLEELEKENEKLKTKLESKDTETQELKKRLDKVESGMFDENLIKAMIEKRVAEILNKK